MEATLTQEFGIRINRETLEREIDEQAEAEASAIRRLCSIRPTIKRKRKRA